MGGMMAEGVARPRGMAPRRGRAKLDEGRLLPPLLMLALLGVLVQAPRAACGSRQDPLARRRGGGPADWARAAAADGLAEHCPNALAINKVSAGGLARPLLQSFQHAMVTCARASPGDASEAPSRPSGGRAAQGERKRMQRKKRNALPFWSPPPAAALPDARGQRRAASYTQGDVTCGTPLCRARTHGAGAEPFAGCCSLCCRVVRV